MKLELPAKHMCWPHASVHSQLAITLASGVSEQSLDGAMSERGLSLSQFLW